MRALPPVLLLALTAAAACAQDPPDPNAFWVAVSVGDDRAAACATGPVGTEFTLTGWAWAPPDSGLAYVTYRFDFPACLAFTARPELHPAAAELIVTPWHDGTSEWNVVFGSCVSGWVRVFAQPCRLATETPGRVAIEAAHSMIRDCGWLLHDVGVAGEVDLQEPGCATVPRAAAAWGAVKSLFR